MVEGMRAALVGSRGQIQQMASPMAPLVITNAPTCKINKPCSKCYSYFYYYYFLKFFLNFINESVIDCTINNKI